MRSRKLGKITNITHSCWVNLGGLRKKSQKSAIFCIWHALCKVTCIAEWPAKLDRMGKKIMQYISTFASRFVAATSALALSLFLISGTVNVPHQTGSSAYVGAIA